MLSLVKFAILIAACAVGVYYLKTYSNGPMCTSNARIDGKVVLITGANTGIGKGTARDLVRRGGRVYLACRSLSRAQAAADDIIKETGVSKDRVQLLQLDLSSFKSIKNAVTEFKKREIHLDILINNAGVAYNDFSTTEDGFELQFGINHLGHFLLTNLLLDTIKDSAPSRIVTVSSIAHTMHGVTTSEYFSHINNATSYNRFDVYSTSKLANILFSRELARRLKGSDVNTYALHPGVIVTELGRNLLSTYPILEWIQPVTRPLLRPFFKDLEYGHQTTLCCSISEDIADETGLYYKDCAVSEPSDMAKNDELAKQLWEYSLQAVGLK